MTEVRLPSGYFPSHLDDLKEVVCEYAAWCCATKWPWGDQVYHYGIAKVSLKTGVQNGRFLLGNTIFSTDSVEPPSSKPRQSSKIHSFFVYSPSYMVHPAEETLQGWAEDISHCTSWEELPVNARKYVERTPRPAADGWGLVHGVVFVGHCRTVEPPNKDK